MLVFGDETTIVSDVVIKASESSNGFIAFNLSNALEKGIGLNNLTPYFEVTEDKSFDMWYAEYVLNNDKAFAEFMSIVYKLYEGSIVYILIDRNDYKDQLTESLIKLIQQRYGYNAYVINELSDWEFVKESEFSIQGLYNLDIDKERFTFLTADFEALQKELNENDAV